MAQSSGLSAMAVVLTAAAAILPLANTFPQPGSAAQELEKLLLEKVVRAEEESKAVTSETAMDRLTVNVVKNNAGSNEIDINDALKQKSYGKQEEKEEEDGDGDALLLESLPGAELQFRDTFSFLKPPDPSTEEQRHPQVEEDSRKDLRIFTVRLPTGNYTGELDERGLRHGWGEMLFKNGSLYGPGGIFLYGDGDRYVGQWQNGTQHGTETHQIVRDLFRSSYLNFFAGGASGPKSESKDKRVPRWGPK